MRAVIQRVKSAKVEIDSKVHGEIGEGLLILLGIEESDSMEDLKWLASKIVQLRIFNDKEGKMNLSLIETKADALLISQFTLHAKTKKGTRPSFIRAARPEQAIPLYEAFHQELESLLKKPVPTGKFGASMQVNLTNDGPVTIILDTKNKE